MVDLLKAVNDADLSPETKANYRTMCNSMCSKAGENITINTILSKPAAYLPLIKKWFPKITSYKVHLSIILGLFRYNKALQTKYAKAREKWAEAFKLADEAVTARYETNKPTERQQEGYVEYAKIIEARDALPKGAINRVLLGMYTYIRPMRCEYARTAIYKSVVPTDAEPNYILLKTGNMIIRQFKTKKHHDSYDIELPEPLLEDIRRSLELRPRDWLFVNRAGEPYTHNMYTAWSMRAFKSIFGKPLTVSLIRHSFINTLDMNTLSIQEKKEIALSMGHTIGTQDSYRLIFTNKLE